jgi:outer membrane lipoprotein-sorting protein/peroxiredoxin
MKSQIAPLAALSLVLVSSNLCAQSLPPEVEVILGNSAAAYRDLKTFSSTMEMTRSSGATDRTVTTTFTLQKPTKLTAEIHSGQDIIHVVADGTNVYSDSSRDKTKYTKQPADKFDDVVTALARNSGAGVGLLPILLTSPNAQGRMIPGKASSAKVLPDETVSGDACDVVEAIVGDGARSARYTFAFGKKDHLLRRLTIGQAADGAKPLAIETYSNVTLEPALTDNTFAYTPAAGAVATAAPAEPEMFDPRVKVGAAPIPISGKDLLGKDVSLDQYKGKVLMLDFWAIWCGPCVAELPNVVAAYNKYHDQGFEVVGISLDEADAKAKLEKFIADNKMPWPQIYDGGHWEAANAVAYGVHAIPFTVLIGRDGKIAAVEARGDELGPAIEAALKKQ